MAVAYADPVDSGPLATQASGPLAGFRFDRHEWSGAVADLGVLVPIAVALIVSNGLAPTAVLLPAGAALRGQRLPLPAAHACPAAQGLRGHCDRPRARRRRDRGRRDPHGGRLRGARGHRAARPGCCGVPALGDPRGPDRRRPPLPEGGVGPGRRPARLVRRARRPDLVAGGRRDRRRRCGVAGRRHGAGAGRRCRGAGDRGGHGMVRPRPWSVRRPLAVLHGRRVLGRRDGARAAAGSLDVRQLLPRPGGRRPRLLRRRGRPPGHTQPAGGEPRSRRPGGWCDRWDAGLPRGRGAHGPPVVRSPDRRCAPDHGCRPAGPRPRRRCRADRRPRALPGRRAGRPAGGRRSAAHGARSAICAPLGLGGRCGRRSLRFSGQLALGLAVGLVLAWGLRRLDRPVDAPTRR
ncbi:MAG: hypothetical protein MZV63_12140 [Marinilabiliales bacterium]|nr:hypothetical protein [Marinilabiliales bacterium]